MKIEWKAVLKDKFSDIRRPYDIFLYFKGQWILLVEHIAWALPDIVYIHCTY